MTRAEYFDHSLSAFAVFTRAEKLEALAIFAALHYPHIEDRFSEGVYQVVKKAYATAPRPA